MSKKFQPCPQPWWTLLNSGKRSTVGLCLTLGLAASGLIAAVTVPQIPGLQNLEALAEPINPNSQSISTAMPSGSQPSKTLPNGVYLYGESAQPEQVGQNYLVFEVQQQQVIGAFYAPHSSFDCFYGTVNAAQALNVTVVDSYEQTSHPYSTSLQTFKPVQAVSANDQRILNTCKTDYQKLVRQGRALPQTTP